MPRTVCGVPYSPYGGRDTLTYLVYSPGLQLHKIGITAGLSRRLLSLRGGCPDIALVETFPYGRELEEWLHARFGATRIPRTEWFSDITGPQVFQAVAQWEVDHA